MDRLRGDNGSGWGLGESTDSHTTIVGNAYPPKSETGGPTFSLYTVGVNVSAIAIAGFTGTAGFYAGYKKDGSFDYGVYVSYGSGYGQLVGASVNVGTTKGIVDDLDGTSVNLSGGYEFVSASTSFGVDGSPNSGSFGGSVGAGLKLGVGLTIENTRSWSLREIFKMKKPPAKKSLITPMP